MKTFATIVAAVALLVPAYGLDDQGRGGGGGGGGGAPSGSSSDPTPFEQFVSKLKLDSKTQLPQVEKIFVAAATEAVPVSQEMIRLRLAMVAADGKPEELAPLNAAFADRAARMTSIEVRAFKQVQALLKPGQVAKAAQAFDLMAGLFQPPTPLPARSFRRVGGGL